MVKNRHDDASGCILAHIDDRGAVTTTFVSRPFYVVTTGAGLRRHAPPTRTTAAMIVTVTSQCE